MDEQQDDFHSIRQESFVGLSAKELQTKRFQPRLNNNVNNKKKPMRVQVSKPPPNAVKIKPAVVPVHFTWALVLTILAFFLIGPCWALYKTIQLRRMIEREEAEEALRVSHKIQTVLIFSTFLAVIVYVAALFCSVGLVITGSLLQSRLI